MFTGHWVWPRALDQGAVQASSARVQAAAHPWVVLAALAGAVSVQRHGGGRLCIALCPLAGRTSVPPGSLLPHPDLVPDPEDRAAGTLQERYVSAGPSGRLGGLLLRASRPSAADTLLPRSWLTPWHGGWPVFRRERVVGDQKAEPDLLSEVCGSPLPARTWVSAYLSDLFLK